MILQLFYIYSGITVKSRKNRIVDCFSTFERDPGIIMEIFQQYSNTW